MNPNALVLVFGFALCAANVSAQALTDPTTPLSIPRTFSTSNAPNTEEDVLDLQSILTRSNDRQALINNQWVKVGDIIEGYRITHINEQSVSLKGTDKSTRNTVNLALYPEVKYRMVSSPNRNQGNKR